MTPPTLHQQWMDLEARARATDVLSARDPMRAANQVLERREALQLARAQNLKMETMAMEFTALSSRVYELATLATRSANGHSWLKDLPHKENATGFYQALRSLIRFLLSRSHD